MGFFRFATSDPGGGGVVGRVPFLPFLPIFWSFLGLLKVIYALSAHVYFALRGCFAEFPIFSGFFGTPAIFFGRFCTNFGIFGNF